MKFLNTEKAKAPFLDRNILPAVGGRRRTHACGGAAIEYIMVSTFAMLMAVGAIVFVSKAVKTKMAKLEEKLGITFEDDSFDLFK